MHIGYCPTVFRNKPATCNGLLGVTVVLILTLAAFHAVLYRDISHLVEETFEDVADQKDENTWMVYERANDPVDAAVVLTETMTTITTADSLPGHARESMSLIFETIVTVITHTVIATPSLPSTAETTTSSVATTSSNAHSSVTHTEKTTAAEPTASDASSSDAPSTDAALMTGIMWCHDTERPHDVYTPCPYVHTQVPGMEQATAMPIAEKVQTSSASRKRSLASSLLADPVGTTRSWLSRSLAGLARRIGRSALRSWTSVAERLHPELESLRQDTMMAEARLHHAWTALGAAPAHSRHAAVVQQEVGADVARAGWAFPEALEDRVAAEVGRLGAEVELLRAELGAAARAVANAEGGGRGHVASLVGAELELQVASLITELRAQRALYDDCVGDKTWRDRMFAEAGGYGHEYGSEGGGQKPGGQL